MSKELRLCPCCAKKWEMDKTTVVVCSRCGMRFGYRDSLPEGVAYFGPCMDDNDRTANQYAQTDNINHPEHYAGPIECIDAMIAAYGKEQVAIFCKICAFKYLWRLEKKGDCKVDAGKAQWYLDKYKEMKR